LNSLSIISATTNRKKHQATRALKSADDNFVEGHTGRVPSVENIDEGFEVCRRKSSYNKISACIFVYDAEKQPIGGAFRIS